MSEPKILFLDIETSPIKANVWGLFKQDIGLNQIVKDWEIISYSAKFKGEKKVYYRDQRKNKEVKLDLEILKELWILLDRADAVVTQNGISFDEKKIRAKFIEANMQPPSSFKSLDTLRISRKVCAFTSHKLEYMAKKLDLKHKKSAHGKFPGMTLWNECCEKNNPEGWREMERYNKLDILALEDLYTRLIPWNTSSAFNPNVYHDNLKHVCLCGSSNFKRNGYAYTSVGKFERYKCKDCGKEARSRYNLLSQEKRATV